MSQTLRIGGVHGIYGQEAGLIVKDISRYYLTVMSNREGGEIINFSIATTYERAVLLLS